MKSTSFLLFIFAASFSGIAQKPAGMTVYSGHITDEPGKRIEYATIVLLKDDIQKAGVTTNDEGDFKLEVENGTYTVVTQCLGYDSVWKTVRLPLSHPDTFSLKRSSYALKEVVVQAKNIERKADRFILSVSPSSGKKRNRVTFAGSRCMVDGRKHLRQWCAGHKSICRQPGDQTHRRRTPLLLTFPEIGRDQTDRGHSHCRGRI